MTEKKTPDIPAQAVALEWQAGKDAPIITATGSGKLAEEIVRLAFDHGVKVRQDKELVEILSLLEMDSPVPADAMGAIAEILRHLYHHNAALKARVTSEATGE